MTVDTILLHLLSVRGWRLWQLIPVPALFLTVDLSFFGANLEIWGGRLVPARHRGGSHGDDDRAWGRRAATKRASGALPLATLVETLSPDRPVRVPGTAIYMTARVENVPAALLHNMKHNKVLHERNVLMNVRTEDVPSLPEAERLEIHHFGQNFHTVTIRYGFLEEPDIPRALALCRVGGLRFNLMDTSFFVRREKIVAKRRSGISLSHSYSSHPSTGARRRRVFQNTGEPDRRARRSDRALGLTRSRGVPNPLVDLLLFGEGSGAAGDREPGDFAASMITFSRRVSNATAAGRSLIASVGITTAPCRSAWITFWRTIMPATPACHRNRRGGHGHARA
jgi:hypothetical protein